MSFNYRVAGYVKLAKLWEKNKEAALSYHKRYYKEKCDKIPGWILQGVYVDITGQKLIYKRPQMLHLLKACGMEKLIVLLSRRKRIWRQTVKNFAICSNFFQKCQGL